jgi:hypothetical protein
VVGVVALVDVVVVVVEVEDDPLDRLQVIVVDDVTLSAIHSDAGVSVRQSSTTGVDDVEVEDEEDDMAGPSLPLRGIELLS